jgi:hypothetical protein
MPRASQRAIGGMRRQCLWLQQEAVLALAAAGGAPCSSETPMCTAREAPPLPPEAPAARNVAGSVRRGQKGEGLPPAARSSMAVAASCRYHFSGQRKACSLTCVCARDSRPPVALIGGAIAQAAWRRSRRHVSNRSLPCNFRRNQLTDNRARGQRQELRLEAGILLAPQSAQLTAVHGPLVPNGQPCQACYSISLGHPAVSQLLP